MLNRIVKLLFMIVLGIGASQSLADIRDPHEQQFIVWPNIPVIRASDFHEYKMDRKIFEDLHAGGDPTQLLAALAAVDQLHGSHHPARALNELGRSLNKQFIGELDRLARRSNLSVPKLRFSFANISPSELQRPIRADAKALDALKAKVNSVTLVIYMTYTQLSRDYPDLQLVATVVKLQTGESESFTVTAPVSNAGEVVAKEVFDYFYGNRFPPYRNPMADKQWVLPAPGHRDQLVSRDLAQRHCRLQGGTLPTSDELEAGEAAGLHHGGVSLAPRSLYHTLTGLYYSSETANVAGKVRPNQEAWASNGYYYCVKSRNGNSVASNQR